MKKLCDRCGSATLAMVHMGGASLCRTCDVEIKPEIEEIRESGKPVNVLQIARKYFKTNFAGGTYHFRDIPADLEKTWKKRAIDDSCNQRDVLLSALVEYLQ